MEKMAATGQNVFSGSYTQRNAKFIAVTSGKGGVGKTSFVMNYAIALAEREKKVLLFDADLGMANVDVLMKASSRYNIIDVIDGFKEMNEVITKTDYHIDLIAGGSGISKLGSLDDLQMKRITDGFTWLQTHYDYVFIDTGAGLSRNVTAFVHAADETIVVTTPEPHAITDAYSIVKVLLEENKKLKLKLLINKCETTGEGEAVMKRVSRVIRDFLGYTINESGCIMESKAVSRSIRQQTPFMASYPTSDVAKCLRGLADEEIALLHEYHADPEPVTNTFVGKFMRLFRMA